MHRMSSTSARAHSSTFSAGSFFGQGRDAKKRVNKLFAIHAGIMFTLGLLSALFPEVLVYLLHHSSEGFHSRHEGGTARVAFVTMRVFGCFLLAQAYLLFVLRGVTDGNMRRAAVQSYFVAFGLTTLALARAQLTEDMPVRLSNWLVILSFFALTMAYAWFSFFERISVYELGR